MMSNKKTPEMGAGKVPSETLSIRIGSDLQGQVEKASELAKQTKTAWVTETLKEATRKALSGEPSKKDYLSVSCKYLLHNPEKLDSLVEAVKSDLASDTTIERLKFIGAVEKLVTGIDAIEPLLKKDKPRVDKVLKEVFQRLRPIPLEQSDFNQKENKELAA